MIRPASNGKIHRGSRPKFKKMATRHMKRYYKDHLKITGISKKQKQPHKAAGRIYLLTERTTAFRQGVLVLSAHMAKGLEFDEVIVPHAGSDNYATIVDKNILYVACTRAMHRLSVTCPDKLTPFI